MSDFTNMSVHMNDDEHVAWKRMARAGIYIDAIKNLRQKSKDHTGVALGLKEAKDIVDVYVARHKAQSLTIEIVQLSDTQSLEVTTQHDGTYTVRHITQYPAYDNIGDLMRMIMSETLRVSADKGVY